MASLNTQYWLGVPSIGPRVTRCTVQWRSGTTHSCNLEASIDNPCSSIFPYLLSGPINLKWRIAHSLLNFITGVAIWRVMWCLQKVSSKHFESGIEIEPKGLKVILFDLIWSDLFTISWWGKCSFLCLRFKVSSSSFEGVLVHIFKGFSRDYQTTIKAEWLNWKGKELEGPGYQDDPLEGGRLSLAELPNTEEGIFGQNFINCFCWKKSLGSNPWYV